MEFLTYKKFYEQESVDTLARILKDNGIEFEITISRDSLDTLYGDKHFNQQFFVNISKDDFSKADIALLSASEKELETVDKDHYLYEFTDEELFDVLCKPDEWNELDFQLSKKILKERGKEISQETIELLKKNRIKELAKPAEGQRNWIYAGYIFALLGGLLGMFIGWHLSSFKKTLPNGQRVFEYTEEDRRHGRRILIIGVIMFMISIIIRIQASEY